MLAQFIHGLIESELNVEQQRQQLALQELFEPYTAFKRIDQQRLGGVRVGDVLEFLQDNQVEASEESVNYLFNYLDQDGDGVVTFDDFQKAILSRGNQKLKDEVSQRETYDIDVAMMLPEEVEHALRDFLVQILQNYNNLIKLDFRDMVVDDNLFDQDGRISVENTHQFLKDHNIQVNEDAILPFIYTIDYEGDGRGNRQALQALIDQFAVHVNEETEEQQDQPEVPEWNENVEQQENDQQPQSEKQDNQEEEIQPEDQQQQPYQQKQEPVYDSGQSFSPKQKEQQKDHFPTSLKEYYEQKIREEESKIEALQSRISQSQYPIPYTPSRSNFLETRKEALLRDQIWLERKRLLELSIRNPYYYPYPRYSDIEYLREKIRLEVEYDMEIRKLVRSRIQPLHRMTPPTTLSYSSPVKKQFQPDLQSKDSQLTPMKPECQAPQRETAQFQLNYNEARGKDLLESQNI